MSEKLCKECGLPFEPKSPKQVYCKRDHYRPCPICNKLVLAKYLPDPPRCCSKECAVKLRASTCIDKYGVADAGNSKASKEKRRLTNLSRYGVENPAMRKDIIDKQKATMMSKYGVEHYSQLQSSKDRVKLIWNNKSEDELEDIKAKRRQTCIDRYGVDNPNKCDEFKQKIKDTLLIKYGVNCSLLIPEAKAATKATMLKRYGVLNPGKSSEIREKTKETCVKRYGVPYYLMSPEFQSKYKLTCKERYGCENVMQNVDIQEKAKATNMKKYGVPAAFLTEESMKKCRDSMLSSSCTSRISKINRNFSELLKLADIDNELEFNIENRWYDILIPSDKIVIEIDPTYTHSAEGNKYNNKLDKYYHRDKTQLASKHGYRCIHVFDWDDLSKIVGLVSKPKIHYYAKDLECKLISDEVANIFLETYHIQGSVRGQEVCLGLLKDDELISVMTFGRPRYNKNVEWELYRFACQFNVSVTGGASKLFKHFLRLIDPHSVVSYCDLAKFTGDVYTKLGFKLKHKSSPTKVWSKGKQYITNNLLLSRGYDQLFNTNYGKGSSNEELMIASGWHSIYDCGQATYIYMRPEDFQ